MIIIKTDHDFIKQYKNFIPDNNTLTTEINFLLFDLKNIEKNH